MTVTVDAGEDEQLTHARARIGLIVKDKWRLDALLGVGGMAAVYSATHRNKNRAAVKMLHAELSGDGETRKRFLREGYAANVVGHPGAVSVLDDDITEDGVAFLVMELLQGETLEARLVRKGDKLPINEVLAFADQLLDVLAAAHSKGIVHRDIKPENLFLTREGILKVLDFGIARVFESKSHGVKKTRAGEIMGTPAFMAPEQALAKWDLVDGRTDLWAVGATMFTLITGDVVHPGESSNEQLIFSATRPARSVTTLARGLPRSVVEVVDRALAFKKEERWADARAMQQAVRAAGAAPSADVAVAPHAPSIPRIGLPDELPPASLPSMRMSLDSVAQQALASTRTAERDVHLEEIANMQPIVADATRRLAEARRRVAEVQARVNAAKAEREAIAQGFKTHVDTRTSAADQAREQLNAGLAEFARAVVADTVVFGAEFNAARDEIQSLGNAAEVVEHDVAVHEAALHAYDAKSYMRGIILAVAVVVVALLLFFSPVIVRLIADA